MLFMLLKVGLYKEKVQFIYYEEVSLVVMWTAARPFFRKMRIFMYRKNSPYLLAKFSVQKYGYCP